VVAAKYLKFLLDGDVTIPHVREWADSVWHLFIVQVTEREQLQKKLAMSKLVP
jgi:dTDP-4-amino-4,6-dideoxygalactose transaminase